MWRPVAPMKIKRNSGNMGEVMQRERGPRRGRRWGGG